VCGIAGIIASGTERPDEFLTTALKLQRHRGPDAEDRLVNGHIGVCHSRLSIIDLEGGRQPMLFEHWAIVFNGEIYNYKELRTDLQSKGFTFATQSDTEVILKGYVHYGTDILPMLRGMFAFCIWNRRESSMFLARDPFGIKPVHYFSAGGTFAFSSEINPLAAQFKRSLQVDTQAIDAFLTLQYIPSPYTIFRHVHKLPPGSWMKVDTNGIITKRGHLFRHCYIYAYCCETGVLCRS
jgi:asparagine synthase (glutamine-hydrolysing)